MESSPGSSFSLIVSRHESDGAVITEVPKQLVVNASGIGKRFGENDVVQDVSFEVEAGPIFGIVGPSGSGKTTTIRMVLGVLHPIRLAAP